MRPAALRRRQFAVGVMHVHQLSCLPLPWRYTCDRLTALRSDVYGTSSFGTNFSVIPGCAWQAAFRDVRGTDPAAAAPPRDAGGYERARERLAFGRVHAFRDRQAPAGRPAYAEQPPGPHAAAQEDRAAGVRQ